MKVDRNRQVYISTQKAPHQGRIVIYDLSKSKPEVAEELTAFANHLERDKLLDTKTIINRIYSIARIKEFLHSHAMKCESDTNTYAILSDDTLKKYRLSLIADAPKRAKRTRTRAHAGTVNSNLSPVYDWIHWLQRTGRAPASTIGPFPSAVNSSCIPNRPNQWSKPLLLLRAGKGARSKPMGFVPDDEMKEKVLEHLSTASSSEYLSVRNSLIQRMAERVGIRRDSIASLVVAPFGRILLDSCQYTSVDVTPKRQKNNYDDSFLVPLDLAYEICSFIEHLRATLVAKTGSDFQEVFLSSRNGEPLRPASMTKIFSTAMRVSGAPVGAALHAWRHRFVQDEVNREMAFRLAKGFDTSDASVCAAVSKRIGHKNLDSIQPYLDSWYTRQQKVKRNAV